jgi:hypothetical protein
MNLRLPAKLASRITVTMVVLMLASLVIIPRISESRSLLESSRRLEELSTKVAEVETLGEYGDVLALAGLNNLRTLSVHDCAGVHLYIDFLEIMIESYRSDPGGLSDNAAESLELQRDTLELECPTSMSPTPAGIVVLPTLIDAAEKLITATEMRRLALEKQEIDELESDVKRRFERMENQGISFLGQNVGLDGAGQAGLLLLIILGVAALVHACLMGELRAMILTCGLRDAQNKIADWDSIETFSVLAALGHPLARLGQAAVQWTVSIMLSSLVVVLFVASPGTDSVAWPSYVAFLIWFCSLEVARYLSMRVQKTYHLKNLEGLVVPSATEGSVTMAEVEHPAGAALPVPPEADDSAKVAEVENPLGAESSAVPPEGSVATAEVE